MYLNDATFSFHLCVFMRERGEGGGRGGEGKEEQENTHTWHLRHNLGIFYLNHKLAQGFY